MRFKICWCVTALGLLVAINGCNKSGLVSASGRVTYKGQGVPATLVVFQPQEEGKRASRGLTDDDGNFKLSNSREETGVLIGKHTVTLKYHPGSDEALGKTKPKASKELQKVIAGFSDLKTSNLKYEVTTNGQFFEIKLE
jgi:hypothetical protein